MRSWLRRPARSIVFLAGSAFVGNQWSIPAEGYNATAAAAEKGYFAFTVDYLGTGRSHSPVNGHDASYEVNREAIKTLLSYIQLIRDVPRIDLFGGGYGGAIAAELAADATRVRSVVMASMLYTEIAGGPLTNPDFISFLESSPSGYFFAQGEGSLIFMEEAPRAAREYIASTQGGFYPVDNFLVATDRPFFDPSAARAAGLVIYGGRDFIAPEEDIRRLAADYGLRGAQFAINPEAGHAPHVESAENAAWFWGQVFSFFDQAQLTAIHLPAPTPIPLPSPVLE